MNFLKKQKSVFEPAASDLDFALEEYAMNDFLGILLIFEQIGAKVVITIY